MSVQSCPTVVILCLTVLVFDRFSTIHSLLDSHQYQELNLSEKERLEKNRSGNRTSSRQSFVPATVASDLSVTAVVYNSQRRLLQLHIRWSISPEGKKPESYNIHVTPELSQASCHMEPFYAFVPNKDTTELKVPSLGAAIPHESLHVWPGCSYRVTIESNPHDGKSSASVVYTVPDCVEDVCSCAHARRLPRPHVRVSVGVADMINITWFLLDHDQHQQFNISAFIVGVGKEVMKSASQQSVYNTSWVRTVPASSTATMYNLLHVISGKGDYLASVKVKDSRNCLGPPGNHSFSISGEENYAVTGFTKKEVVWMTLLPSISVVLALCITLGKVWRRGVQWCHRLCMWGPGTSLRRLRPDQPQWTGVYKAISVDSGRSLRVNFPSLQERNVLYVEKEIDEARVRGEADDYEVSYNRLALGRQIGKGAFGRVFLARAEAIAGIPGSIVVAVKKLKHKATCDEVEEFLAEITMMKRVGRHPHIVTMVGCCTLKQPFCMVMEYVPCGDLLAYLRHLRGQSKPLPQTSATSRVSATSDASYITPIPTTSCVSSTQPSTRCSNVSSIVLDSTNLECELDPRELHSFATQIARGMEYLESKTITHRDLAARNILIDEKRSLKISDFGLSRTGIYVNTKRRKVPLRWLSVEAMRDSLYSSKSDVWAFGVVLWEIGTLGGFPYPTVSDHELLQYLVSGKRLEQPDNFSDELYALMEICWSLSVDERPSFKEILFQLDSSPRKSVYVEFRPGHQFPPTQQTSSSTISTVTTFV